jgi:hypothetical protein
MKKMWLGENRLVENVQGEAWTKDKVKNGQKIRSNVRRKYTQT